MGAETEDGLTYTISDGEVTITGCDVSKSGELVIPSVLDGYPVTGIGIYAFRYCKNLESVIIPESVKAISGNAFAECAALKSVIIHDGVTSIGGAAFKSCGSLKSVTFLSLRTTIFYDTFNGLDKSLIIKGYKDSTAEFYAKNYEFVFVEIKDTTSIPGDINGDDAVNILDLIGFKKLFAGNTESIEYSAHLDVSGDKIIDTPDLAALRRKILS